MYSVRFLTSLRRLSARKCDQIYVSVAFEVRCELTGDKHVCQSRARRFFYVYIFKMNRIPSSLSRLLIDLFATNEMTAGKPNLRCFWLKFLLGGQVNRVFGNILNSRLFMSNNCTLHPSSSLKRNP